MRNNYHTKIEEQLLVLYELSFAAMSSTNIRENCLLFFKTLMSRKNLNSAIYLRWDKVLNNDSIQYCQHIPKRVMKNNFKFSHNFLQKLFEDETDKIVDQEGLKTLKEILHTPQKYHLCYRISAQSILILGRELHPFTEKEKNQLSRVMHKFGHYMEGLFYREEIKLESQKRKESEQNLLAKNEELQRYISSNIQLENFAHIASHDLKAPLRTIKSYSELLELKIKNRLQEDEQELLKMIKNSSANMTALINDLLSYSKIDTEPMLFRKVKTIDLIDSILNEIKFDIATKKASIKIENLPENIIVDRVKVRQVFQNLISNAIKYSKEKTVPRIKINCTELINFWQFTVEDNGVGIEKHFHERVFHMFQRIISSNKHQGSGIGLAICKKVIQYHGGTIRLESELNHGSKFIFTIPKRLVSTITNYNKQYSSTQSIHSFENLKNKLTKDK